MECSNNSMLVDHACIWKQLKLETTSSQKTSCQTQVSDSKFSSYWWFQIISQNSMIIQIFSNSMIFPCMELILVIFQVFHDFQSLSEPCTMKVWGRARIKRTTPGSAIKLSTNCATAVDNELVLLKTSACLINLIL